MEEANTGALNLSIHFSSKFAPVCLHEDNKKVLIEGTATFFFS